MFEDILIIEFVFIAAECGIVDQILDPIAESKVSLYYISTFYSDHTLVSIESHVKSGNHHCDK